MRRTLLFYILVAVQFHSQLNAQVSLLTADQITLSHTWSQEPEGWDYPLFVHIPEGANPSDPMPVCIALHGSGSNGDEMGTYVSAWLECHIIVAPSGYGEGWNLCSETSNAPDIEMLSNLLAQLASFQNVDTSNISLLGLSNGGGLVNQGLIELSDYDISAFVPIVSQMNEPQFHNDSFHKPLSSDSTNPGAMFCGYSVPVVIPTEIRYLSVCNTNDPIIPFDGGFAVGNVFLPAIEAINRVAESQGYTGVQVTSGDDIGNDLLVYDFIGVDVQMLSGNSFHGLSGEQEDYISSFLLDCLGSSYTHEQKRLPDCAIAPNPATTSITISADVALLNSPYRITDVQGKLLMEGALRNTTTVLNSDQLSNGQYTLTIIADEAVITKPLIIQK